jgi:D-alanyl-D-alanine carboxypeptidase
MPAGISAKVIDYVSTLNREALMNTEALVMLKTMFASADKHGYNEFRVTEGYRTYDYQQSLYDSAADKSFVALPGHSEHHTGLAADISYNGVNIQTSTQGAWLKDNAYQYGFILRYPQNKESITQIPYEPWHYRYVGQPHAYYCWKNALVLEEYIDFLKEIGDYSVTFGGKKYTVLYQKSQNDIIYVPNTPNFNISNDNTGGYIITAWE